jgi:hypothetical protein
MTKRPTDREAIRRLQDALVEDIMSASDEEIAAEAMEEGVDLERQAEAMRAMFERQVLEAGKARMTAAKAAAAAYRAGAAPGGPMPPAPTGYRAAATKTTDRARKLTMAARNGAEQSERDLAGVEEDLAELAALQKREGEES